jgi:hypothetical protein
MTHVESPTATKVSVSALRNASMPAKTGKTSARGSAGAASWLLGTAPALKDQRERANFAKREPKRLAAMRARYLAWEETLPSHPDATYSVPATPADLVTPSS